MKIKLYIDNISSPNLPFNGEQIDLFEDEAVNVVNKINDIEKLSSIFSDFSLSFTVPATPSNNRKFKHYYDLDIDNTFDANVRVNAILEIDTFTFKIGQLQLESVEIKDSVPDNYKIGFYSKVSQLSDLFGNDTIDLLEFDLVGSSLVKNRSNFSQFDFPYNQTNLLKTINDNSYLDNNLITPLIAYANRDWNYGTADATDISLGPTAILNKELKSALKVINIFNAIEEKYGITFSRQILDSRMFQKLFIALKTSDDNFTERQLIVNDALPNNLTSVGYNYATNVWTFQDTDHLWHNYKIDITTLTVNIPYRLIIKDNGNTIKTIDFDGGDGTSTLLYIGALDSPTPTTRNLTFHISSPPAFIFSFILRLGYRDDPFTITLPNDSGEGFNYSVSDNLPKIKVLDFLQGVMKLFKLVIQPITNNDFYLNTIDNFYLGGKIIDITAFVDQSSILVKRPDIFSDVDFKFEATENVLGKKFKDVNLNNIGYGDLSSTKKISDKKELVIKVPFENMLFERLFDASIPESDGIDPTLNILIGQASKLTSDGITLEENKTMKPILFFFNGIQDITDNPLSFKFNNGTPTTLNSYKLVSNTDNSVFNDVTTSLNFGQEFDPWHQREVSKSLFFNFWKGWFDTIYNIKQRKVECKAVLPSRIIEDIKLNDRLVIVDQRFKINDYKINIVTGDADLNLFKDIY